MFTTRACSQRCSTLSLRSVVPVAALVAHANAPEKLHADKAYDFDRCREALCQRGIAPRIARRGLDSSERLGRHRWVAERTLAWLNRYRRLKVRYERLADVHQAFLSLGCALVCWNFVRRACEVG